jgi:hypothetical protein
MGGWIGMTSDWKYFEDLVEGHLNRTRRKVNVQPNRRGSHPDFTTRAYLVFKQVVDAKSGQRITMNDVTKLHRDMKRHRAVRGIMYIATDTQVSKDLVREAHRRGIRFNRLGWNGHLLKKF